jgi:hypothetical protein
MPVRLLPSARTTLVLPIVALGLGAPLSSGCSGESASACEWQSQDRSLSHRCFNTSAELCGGGAEFHPEHIPLPFPFIVPAYWSYRVYSEGTTCEELGYAYACSDESAEITYYETEESCAETPAAAGFDERLQELLDAVGGEGCAEDLALTMRCEADGVLPVGWRCFDESINVQCEALEGEPFGFCCP